MDKEEAKLILQSYRSNGCDVQDPAFAEALAMARKDPELGRWFESEQALDAAITGKLHEAPVPTDLKPAILAGLRSEAKVARPTAVNWWKSPALAWAACIVLVFAAALFLQDQGPPRSQLALADYRTAMRMNLDTLDGFDIRDPDPTAIETWLKSQDAVDNVRIPEKLVEKTSVGCRLFPYNGTQSALICFQLPNMEMVHLFVIERAAITTVARNSSEAFAQCGDWDTCLWEEGENLYLLLGKNGNDALRQLAH